MNDQNTNINADSFWDGTCLALALWITPMIPGLSKILTCLRNK